MPRSIGAYEDTWAQTRALRARQALQEAQAQAWEALAALVLDAAERAAAAQSRPRARQRSDAPGDVRRTRGRAAAVACGIRPAPRRRRSLRADGPRCRRQRADPPAGRAARRPRA